MAGPHFMVFNSTAQFCPVKRIKLPLPFLKQTSGLRCFGCEKTYLGSFPIRLLNLQTLVTANIPLEMGLVLDNFHGKIRKIQLATKVVETLLANDGFHYILSFNFICIQR